MKPTVSVMRNERPCSWSVRVVGASVWKRGGRRAPPRREGAGGGVQGWEQAVAHADVRAGQRVEQRRLARVGVAGQRDRGQMCPLALGALGGAGGLDLLEAALEDRDAVARQAAVGLDLRLARAARAD